MEIGHISIEKPTDEFREHFVSLVEALSRHGAHQHVLVSDALSAKRLAGCDNVSTGPIARTPISAYCLMPNVDLVHAHGIKSGQSALLLMLNRSTPFVLSDKGESCTSKNPVNRSVYRRAVSVVCQSDDAAKRLLERMPDTIVDVMPDIGPGESIDVVEKNRKNAASEHLQIYHRAVDVSRVPAILL